jgi:CRISPR-associated protein Cas2
MLVLIVYDIPDDKRRNKLAKFLEGYGRRIQLSVFECFLNLDEMRQVHQLVIDRVQPDEDNVRFYWISAEAISRVLTIGSLEPSPPPSFYVI